MKRPESPLPSEPALDETRAMNRRLCLLAGLSGLTWSASSLLTPVRAGGQLEEPLADSVRSALASAIANSAPPEPVFSNTERRLAYLRWLGAMSDRLQRRKPDFQTRIEFLQTVWYETRRAGLDTTMVMGLIQVESAFRKFAISRVGARGYMQIMPFWSRVIGDGEVGKLFDMRVNLRFGCVILRHYLDRERGDTFMALGRYNGSRGRAEYPNAVYAAARNWIHPDA
ncbi:soluble lytic murein transglycosylase-like protein [Hydrogenophaga palleronii]|uniref:Soluble lytic murein transglycosylase-like protein n=1 Tax=Hydrogenophaga palleronii TaxID=65655 RepID=A0ABU1WP97_9BURK|nr:transglycosylase SLT domain-containing protein [Hydrogenophaga palleronii]MDR7151106.1 soluble lytic murein transglycosylase-like protein [Hydrogenophaga palleronii]